MAEVAVCGLTKRFGQLTAVRELSFTAPAGKVKPAQRARGVGRSRQRR